MLSVLKFGFPALLLILSVAGADGARSKMNATAIHPASMDRAAEDVAVKERPAGGAGGMIMAAERKMEQRQFQLKKKKRLQVAPQLQRRQRMQMAPPRIIEGAVIRGNRATIQKGYRIRRRSQSQAVLMMGNRETGTMKCVCIRPGTGTCDSEVSNGTMVCERSDKGGCMGNCKIEVVITPGTTARPGELRLKK